MKCLRLLEYWGRAFEFDSRHGCLSTFILFLLSRVGSCLTIGLIPHPRNPTDWRRLRNWSETKRFTDALCSRGSNRNMNELTSRHSEVNSIHYRNEVASLSVSNVDRYVIIGNFVYFYILVFPHLYAAGNFKCTFVWRFHIRLHAQIATYPCP
jgi:hypothetical protein